MWHALGFVRVHWLMCDMWLAAAATPACICLSAAARVAFEGQWVNTIEEVKDKDR